MGRRGFGYFGLTEYNALPEEIVLFNNKTQEESSRHFHCKTVDHYIYLNYSELFCKSNIVV